MSVPVIVVFRPKPGQAERLATLVKRHAAILRSAGLATDRAPYVMQAKDGAFVEVFEWVSEAAMMRAATLWKNPEIDPDDADAIQIRELWAGLEAASDYAPFNTLAESASLFARFETVAL